jgi:sporulation protein YlmC with PRC-barrel domain
MQRDVNMSEATSITTGTLIAADKVKGTDVYNLAGDKLGSVDDIMIDKVSDIGGTSLLHVELE